MIIPRERAHGFEVFINPIKGGPAAFQDALLIVVLRRAVNGDLVGGYSPFQKIFEFVRSKQIAIGGYIGSIGDLVLFRRLPEYGSQFFYSFIAQQRFSAEPGYLECIQVDRKSTRLN